MDRMPRKDRVVSTAPWLRGYRYAPKPVPISEVQWLIAQLITCGLSDKEIAYILSVSRSTVKAHNNKTLRSLNLLRRGQIVRYMFETGQFDPDAAEACLNERRRRPERAAQPR